MIKLLLDATLKMYSNGVVGKISELLFEFIC